MSWSSDPCRRSDADDLRRVKLVITVKATILSVLLALGCWIPREAIAEAEIKLDGRQKRVIELSRKPVSGS